MFFIFSESALKNVKSLKQHYYALIMSGTSTRVIIKFQLSFCKIWKKTSLQLNNKWWVISGQPGVLRYDLLTYSWTVPNPEAGNYFFRYQGAKLEIIKATLENNGDYQCSVRNQDREVSVTMTLFVYGKIRSNFTNVLKNLENWSFCISHGIFVFNFSFKCIFKIRSIRGTFFVKQP